MKKCNQAKCLWKAENSDRRYTKRVKDSRLICQECGGSGMVTEDQIDFGDDWCGPIMFPMYAPCDWCKGTGKLTPWLRGQWLKYKREEKRDSTPVR